MFVDAQQLLSDAQALTATVVSTNIIDLGSDRDIGIGEPLSVVVNVDVAADATTGDETYQFDLQTDDNSGFSSATVLLSRVIGRTLLTAGSRHVIPVPADKSAERFLRLNYVLGGTTPTITVTSHLQPSNALQAEGVYPDDITIS